MFKTQEEPQAAGKTKQIAQLSRHFHGLYS